MDFKPLPSFSNTQYTCKSFDAAHQQLSMEEPCMQGQVKYYLAIHIIRLTFFVGFISI